MSSREAPSHGGRRPRGKALVADLLAVAEHRVQSLSWSLGHRVAVENDTDRLFALDHQSSRRRVVAFEATDDTCVLRLRTPVGREKFYGVAKADLREASDHAAWVATD